ncbi:MAG: DsbA family protein [Candidatus Falkowbacteria bacterium]
MSLEDRVKFAEMKARHEKKLRPWYKKWWGVFIILIIGLILIALVSSGFYIYNEIKRINEEDAQNYIKDQHQAYLDLISGPGGYTIGTLTPKITVVEFTDFACPYCKQSAPEIRKLMEEYKDTVKLVIRDYPIHDNSIDLAIAARCAGEQGKYWEAYDSLFTNQDNLIGTSTIQNDILSWGEFLKLDSARFKTCITDKRYIDLVKRDYDDGNKLKIQGTPTWFVNNYPITGYYSAERFKELFDGILQQIK